MNTRVLTANILKNVVYHGKSLSTELQLSINKYSSNDHAFLQELCYGSLRWWHKLDFIAKQLLHKPLRTKDYDVHCLLITGLYQILFMRIPDYATVSETVKAVTFLKKSWASGLINKLLRNFIKQKETLLEKCNQDLEARFSHPIWLIEKLQKDWPSHWQAILDANNIAPPMFLRINKQQTTRDAYLKLLSEQSIKAQPIPESETAIWLIKPLPVEHIPGFFQGFCSVQDIAGQQVINLLELKSGLRVLDACAAPGSKTCHILETEAQLKKLIAIDKDHERLNRLQENIQRLKLPSSNLEIKTADVCEVKSWWDDELFDRILLDAPCSGTGVIRRHPDIKILRQPADIFNLASLQLKLLKSLWPLLKNNGMLIYTTCSIFQDENVSVINDFIKTEPSAKAKSAELFNVMNQQHGYQTLPTENLTDGFFYAVLEKKLETHA